MSAHLNGVVNFRGVSPIQKEYTELNLKAFEAGLEEAARN